MAVRREQFRRRLAKKTAVARSVIPRCRARFLSIRRPLRLQSDSRGRWVPGGYVGRKERDSPVTEMLLMVRSYVVAHLNSPSRQTGFISNRAQAVKSSQKAIATELEELERLKHI